MSIQINPEGTLFSLRTRHSLYQMAVDEAGVLRHLYYGAPAEGDLRYLIRLTDRGFSGNPYEMQEHREYSLDTLPQEYGSAGVGDYRSPAVVPRYANGSASADWRFDGYRLLRGKEPLPGLPSLRGDGDTPGLEITLRDTATGFRAVLTWYLFEETDVITRSARLENRGNVPMELEKAASMSMDFPYGKWQVMHFHGRHCMERQPQREPVPRGGSLVFESRRGMSSHHCNPFLILCAPETTERQGDCYGFMPVYSGSHRQEVGMDQTGSLRVVSGIQPEGFRWLLNPGDSFQTPEVILAYSGEGLNGLSRRYHRVIRDRLIPTRWRDAHRPVLLNSWEAVYFNFNAEKMLELAKAARDLGVELLVMDDGWFGRREDDTSSLGDWVPNEKKLGGTLGALSERIHALGLSFGLWLEPEMISEDSDLYRAHPDWALKDPDRLPAVSRRQLVLDLGRQEVVDYLFERIDTLLREVRLEYIKWDFNRSLANFYSGALPASRQGETAHRFMLGTYQLLERLTRAWPEIMIEGCAGGGGRFDAGMLYYCPQIWCSDDTDAVERLEIQRGTSYGYPISSMGSHVSAVPNHQTGRTVPLETRGAVAAAGTFGYELNPALLSETEKETVRRQIEDFHRDEALICHGDYYRLTELEENRDFESWMLVSPDRDQALLTLVMTHVRAGGDFPFVRLAGLKEEAVYEIQETGEKISGAALMRAGYSFPLLMGDCPALRLHLTETA